MKTLIILLLLVLSCVNPLESKQEKRFKVIYTQVNFEMKIFIIIDNQTGKKYLMVKNEGVGLIELKD